MSTAGTPSRDSSCGGTRPSPTTRRSNGASPPPSTPEKERHGDDAKRSELRCGWRPTSERGVDGPPRSRRVPAPLVAEGERRDGSGVPRQAADRDLQQLERARELQRPPTRSGRVGQARRAAGGRGPPPVPPEVARRGADETASARLPEPADR